MNRSTTIIWFLYSLNYSGDCWSRYIVGAVFYVPMRIKRCSIDWSFFIFCFSSVGKGEGRGGEGLLGIRSYFISYFWQKGMLSLCFLLLLFPNVYHFGLMWVNIWSSGYFLSLLLFKESGSGPDVWFFSANVSGNVPPSHRHNFKIWYSRFYWPRSTEDPANPHWFVAVSF